MDKNRQVLMNIAIKVRNARFEQQLSQEDLSQLSGLSVNCISNMENAKQDTRISSLVSVANALNIPLVDFFNG